MTRDEAINTLANFKVYISGGGVTDKKANEAIDFAIVTLVNLPSADRPTGEWILSDDRCWKTCSECGADVDVSISLGIYVDNDEVSEMCFCPNCGAKMLREDNK